MSPIQPARSTGEHLETVRISNDPEYLGQVMARAGGCPEVVLEATLARVYLISS
ncbi:MAG TPA: hypothetical protein VK735_21905 [Pseudonocardia sp.]|uniref:hypothetical protein n=1 Tax=Pseudonocardia sp. TaxID=60912 RepID=UPI002B87A3D0|nr:hypothetical protein [Pseudonocardia sp.]HTF50105.1 hypothetical protein [Pseudonocardia sp.]